MCIINMMPGASLPGHSGLLESNGVCKVRDTVIIDQMANESLVRRFE